jgi:hypothetical protein
MACGGACVDTRFDPAHCGGCDQPCPSGQACLDGACSLDVSECGAPLSLESAMADFRAGLGSSGVAVVAFATPAFAVGARVWDPASLVWGEREDIYAPPANILNVASLKVAVGDAGAATVAFTVYLPGPRSFPAVSRRDGVSRAWGPTVVAADDGHSITNPSLAVSPSGAALAVGRDGQTANLVARRYDPGAGAWLPTETLDAPLPADNILGRAPVRVAFGANDRAIAVWSEADAASGTVTVVGRRLDPAAGGWLAREAIGPTRGDAPFGIWAHPAANGDVMVVWRVLDPAGSGQAITWANRFGAAAGAWGAPQVLGAVDPVFAADEPLAVDAGGDAVVVGNTARPSADQGYGLWTDRFHAASATWDLPRAEPSAYLEAGPVAMNARGDAVVVYQDDSTGVAATLFRRATGGGDWGAPLRAPGRPVQIALADSGALLLAWQDLPPGTAVPDPFELWVAWCGP